jgi:predicted transcriptional regulator
MERPEQFFPRIRAQLAYRLVEKYGLKKSVVAQVIGVSPSAVTQYLEGRRGSRRSEAKLEGELDSLAENIARKVELGLLEAA